MKIGLRWIRHYHLPVIRGMQSTLVPVAGRLRRDKKRTGRYLRHIASGLQEVEERTALIERQDDSHAGEVVGLLWIVPGDREFIRFDIGVVFLPETFSKDEVREVLGLLEAELKIILAQPPAMPPDVTEVGKVIRQMIERLGGENGA